MTQGYFFADQTPEQEQISRRQAMAEEMLKRATQSPGSVPGAGLAHFGSALLGAYLSKGADKDAKEAETKREDSYTRGLANLLGPSDNSTWDTGPGVDAQGNPAPLDVSPRVGAPLGDRLAATGNPDLIKQMGPQLAAQLMSQNAQANAPITPYQRANMDRDAANDAEGQRRWDSGELDRQRASAEAAMQQSHNNVRQMQQDDPAYKGRVAAAEAEGRLPAEKELANVKADASLRQQLGDANDIESMAQGIAGYKLAPLSGFAVSKPAGQAIMARAQQINPNYNAQNFTKSQQAYKDFGSGKKGDLTRSFNVSISHLNTLDKLTDALGNGNVQAINQVSNAFKEQFGSEAPTNFNAAKAIVGDEIIKAIVGGGGALADRENAQNQISAAKTPGQLKGVIKTYKDLMAGQLRGLKQQYESSTMRGDFDTLLSGDAKTELEGAPAAAAAPRGAQFRYDANGNRVQQ